MLAMKANKPAKIDLEERISIHDEDVSGMLNVRLRQFQGSCRAERVRFSRVLNVQSPSTAISELVFDLFGHVSRAHDQMANALPFEFSHQQLEEGFSADRGHWFWTRRYDGTKTSPHSAYKEDGGYMIEHVHLILSETVSLHGRFETT
jgi:hypothetical protein